MSITYPAASNTYYGNRLLPAPLIPSIPAGITVNAWSITSQYSGGHFTIDSNTGYITGWGHSSVNPIRINVNATTATGVISLRLNITVVQQFIRFYKNDLINYKYSFPLFINSPTMIIPTLEPILPGYSDISHNFVWMLNDNNFNSPTSLPNGLNLDVNTGIIFGTPSIYDTNNYLIYGDLIGSYDGLPFSRGEGLMMNAPIQIIIGDINYSELTTSYLSGVPIVPIVPTYNSMIVSSYDSYPDDMIFNLTPNIPGVGVDTNGNITGTPSQSSLLQTYNLAVIAFNLTKDFSFNLGVVDINYALTNQLLRMIPSSVGPITNSTNLNYSEIFNPLPTLPEGLTMDYAGNINGTPSAISPQATYTFTFGTKNIYTADYIKDVTFSLGVSDVSYANIVPYDFMSDVSINPINSLTSYTNLTNTSLSFSPSIQGLNIDGSGNISGIPTHAAKPANYNLNLTTTNVNTSNYTKSIPFTIGVVDLSYTHVNYNFMSDISINKIVTLTANTNLVDASFNLSQPLPNGLAIDASGNIDGTPIGASAQQPYTIELFTTNSLQPYNYQKQISLTMGVVDLSYTYVNHGFLSDVSINPIQPFLPQTNLVDASLNFTEVLPQGLVLDASGNINGTPIGGRAAEAYNLQVYTTNSFPYNYQKTIPFTLGVVDLSYTYVNHGFLSDVSINKIQALLPQTNLVDASLNFTQALPKGLVLDASGNINGTPVGARAAETYNLQVYTTQTLPYNYQKTIPFTLGVVDLSYTYVNHGFLSDVSINKIQPFLPQTNLVDASLNFTQALPTGLRMDASGNINGTPIGGRAAQAYNLQVYTTQTLPYNYQKTIPFTLGVVDLSYTYVNHGFLSDVSINKIQALLPQTNLVDASLNFTQALPKGLVLDASGNINGTPVGARAAETYNLQVYTTQTLPYNYQKTIPFTLGVVDVSYTYVNHGFLSDVSINKIQALMPQTNLVDASLNFTQALPKGLVLDASGNINGTPVGGRTAQAYNLQVYTTQTLPYNYQKTIPFTLGVVDVSYTYVEYDFLSDVSINTIEPILEVTNVIDASLNFIDGLPTGITLDTSGNINGMPVTGAAPKNYTLQVSTSNTKPYNYFKTIPFKFGVVDLSYADLNYSFVTDISINPIIPLTTNKNLIDASFNFSFLTPLPPGLVIDASGIITGQPTTNRESTQYTLILRTTNRNTPNYRKNIIFIIGISDFGYATFVYDFVVDVPVYIIKNSPLPPGATLSFNPALPTGINLAPSGNIIGTPTQITPVYNSTLTMTLPDTTYKTAIFTFSVSDISYNQLTNLTYEFLEGVLIQPINVKYSKLYASAYLYFDPNLPDGLVFDICGNISGTPTLYAPTKTYGLILNTYNNYSKTINFTFTVVDLLYPSLNYAFLNNVLIPPIQPINAIYDGSFQLLNGLPHGLRMDGSGNITGTPTLDTPYTPYDLQISTNNNTYQKTITLNFAVSDLSYDVLNYVFLEGIAIRPILPTLSHLYEANISFPTNLPQGLRYDNYGNITGTPLYSNFPRTYELNLNTVSNSQKSIYFQMTTANLEYDTTNYALLAAVPIEPIIPNPLYTVLYDTTFDFTPPLPSGLYINGSGNITGNVSNYVVNQPYSLNVSTTSGYNKSIPFTFAVSDISYAALTYDFIADVSVNIKPTPANNYLYDSVLQLGPSRLPTGLTLDVCGNITGEPRNPVARQPYTVTLSTNDQVYSKTLTFPLSVSDISYSKVNYKFLSDVSINPINSTYALYDASLNFQPPLPRGLTMDTSGNINGTPVTPLSQSYYLTLSTKSEYRKTIPFEFTVSDVSYTTLNYNFISDVSVNILSSQPGGVYDASLNFLNPLPRGLAMDASGQIRGTPIQPTAPTNYRLKMTTADQVYSKTLTFPLSVSDISYSKVNYKFLSDVSINPINSTYALYDASLNFSTALPRGLTMDTSGNIKGTPVTPLSQPYYLSLSTGSQYKKTIPFTFSVADISYTTLTYNFISDVSVNIQPNDSGSLYDASLNFLNPLPRGLAMDAFGQIRGTPIQPAAPQPYKLSLSTADQVYSKTLTFPLSVSDISYSKVNYKFLSDVSINPINSTYALYDASLNFQQPLPRGLTMDTSGNIKGTPVTPLSQSYYLSLSTGSQYKKTIPFTFSVADISYTMLTYNFISDVSVNIQPNDSGSLYDASLNFMNPLPRGLAMDAFGQIRGTPIQPAAPQPYKLTLSTADQVYSKTLTFPLSVSDISYTTLTYDFFTDVSVNIQPTIKYAIYESSLNFSTTLPDGLRMDNSGVIQGAPLYIERNIPYDLVLSNSQYSKTLPFHLTVSDISYTLLDLNHLFLSDVSINPVRPTLFANLETSTFAFEPPLPEGLEFNTTTGAITGTSDVFTPKDNYTLTATTPSNYKKQITFAITITDISYNALPYVYLRNNPYLYLPIEVRGENIAPIIYDLQNFTSIILENALPNALQFESSNGVITGTPNVATATQNYILTITTKSGYSKKVRINITVNGFNYIPDSYTFQLYDVARIIPQNIGNYTNFTITPSLPGDLYLDPITGIIKGTVYFLPSVEGTSLYYVTGTAPGLLPITVPLTINIIDPNAAACKYKCPPSIILPRQVDTGNTRAMRFSSLARIGQGQMRFILNSGTTLNRTYQEPARNQF